MRDILFIVNPISGNKRKEQIIKAIHKEIDQNKFSYRIVYTKYAGHGEEIARAASQDGIYIVCAVGGDGTINEVARGLVESHTALGIIPCGSGNGLARHLRIPLNTSKAIEILNQNVIADLDYAKINNHPFFCTCGVGFDATISKRFAEGNKRGMKTYVENVIKECFSYKSSLYQITCNETCLNETAFLITCANASQYGNNAYIAPHASMQDGLLDIIIIKEFKMYESPFMLFQLFSKRIDTNAHVRLIKTQELTIEREHEGPIHCDGDPFEAGKKIKIELVPRKFKVVINPILTKTKPTKPSIEK